MPLHRGFLLHEFATLAINGAFQHVAIYAAGVLEADRAELREHLRDHLDKISVDYVQAVHESSHVKNIARVVNSLTRRHAGILKDHRFRWGPAQKALNLYLKYLWCDGLIQTPPHCPIDSIVLRAARVKAPVAWSQIRDESEYTHLIKQIKLAAGNEPLAEWELRVWSQSDVQPLAQAERRPQIQP
jgi:hypothetical protein